MPNSAEECHTKVGCHSVGATIRTRQESQCLPYAGFFNKLYGEKSLLHWVFIYESPVNMLRKNTLKNSHIEETLNI